MRRLFCDISVSLGQCLLSDLLLGHLSGQGAPSGVPSDAGRVSAEYAKEYAESEFEKYRVIQDRLFQSDFDRLVDDNDLLNLSTEQ